MVERQEISVRSTDSTLGSCPERGGTIRQHPLKPESSLPLSSTHTKRHFCFNARYGRHEGRRKEDLIEKVERPCERCGARSPLGVMSGGVSWQPRFDEDVSSKGSREALAPPRCLGAELKDRSVVG